MFGKSLLYSTQINFMLEVYGASAEVEDREMFLKLPLKCSVL